MFLFILCSAVLVFVSHATAEPEMAKLRGLTFRYTERTAPTGTDISSRRLNIVFSIVLISTVVVLWIIFFNAISETVCALSSDGGDCWQPTLEVVAPSLLGHEMSR